MAANYHITMTQVNADKSVDTLYPKNNDVDVILTSTNSNLPEGVTTAKGVIDAIGSAAFKGVDTSVTSDSNNLVTSDAVYDAISQGFAANDAMVLKGVVNANSELPTTKFSAGWTYKVGTAGTYAGQVCEVGDMIVCIVSNDTTTPATPSSTNWHVFQNNLIVDSSFNATSVNPATSKAIATYIAGLGYTGSTGTVTAVTAGTGLTGGGTSGNVTISHATSGVTANSYGANTNTSPAHGGKFNVPTFTVDSNGHITAASTTEITIPAATVNTDHYVTAAAFASDSTANNVKMTLTRTDGTNSTSVTANIPGMSKSAFGVGKVGTTLSVIDATIDLGDSGVTAGSYGESTSTVSHGGTFNIPKVTVDKYGRVTSASNSTITLPSESFVVSENQPAYACVWYKIDSES